MQQNLFPAGFVWCGGVAHADGEGAHAGEGGGPGTPMPDFLINQNVTMP